MQMPCATGSDSWPIDLGLADPAPGVDGEAAVSVVSADSIASRIRRGERAAEQQLAQCFSRPLFAAALRLCRNPTTAEDLVGDTLLKLIVELREAPPRPDPQLMAYALGVVRGMAANLAAKARRQQTDADLAAVARIESHLPSPERQADSAMARDRVAALVRRMPVPRDRLLLTRLMSGVAEHTIQQEFGWSRPQWEKACSRAVQRLRQMAARELADFAGYG